ncbi:MAG: AAA family ATPase [Alphaproteobacteria bacterium]|nr:AAA family ATPase [Alphaproteobacteria bacterium]
MAKIISFFSHKGGVGKTTTVFSLGWTMAEKGKRVLLVDFDPQCNLTGLTLGYKGVEDLEKFYKNDPANNIKDALAPAFESQPKAIVGAECIQIDQQKNLYILPGHIDMAQYESTLNLAQQLGPELIVLKNIPGSLKFMIDRTAEKYAIDYVLVDLNPSLGPMNMNLLMASDYFIVPLQPDYFSAMAIRSLARIMPLWKKWSIHAGNSRILNEANYPFYQSHVQFAGAVIQRFEMRDGRPAAAFNLWFDQLKKSLKEVFVPSLIASDMLNESIYLQATGQEPDLPIMEAKDFKSLMALSHDRNVPVFALPEEALGSGVVKDGQEGRMSEYREIYSNFADKVFSMSSLSDSVIRSVNAA